MLSLWAILKMTVLSFAYCNRNVFLAHVSSPSVRLFLYTLLPLLIIEFRTRAHPHQEGYSIVPFLNELWRSINFKWSSRRIFNFLSIVIFLSSLRSLYISSQAFTSFNRQLILHCCQISLLLLWPQYSYITTERKGERQCSSNGVTVKIIRIVCSARQRSFIDDRGYCPCRGKVNFVVVVGVVVVGKRAPN